MFKQLRLINRYTVELLSNLNRNIKLNFEIMKSLYILRFIIERYSISRGRTLVKIKFFYMEAFPKISFSRAVLTIPLVVTPSFDLIYAVKVMLLLVQLDTSFSTPCNNLRYVGHCLYLYTK